jgi:hypothetical protein
MWESGGNNAKSILIEVKSHRCTEFELKKEHLPLKHKSLLMEKVERRMGRLVLKEEVLILQPILILISQRAY